jgi:hypothetical protein
MAAELGMSTSSVYKWTQDKPDEVQNGSGIVNPLDRVLQICEHAQDHGPLQWLCQKMGGYYVSNYPIDKDQVEFEFLQSTQQMLAEFSDLLKTLSSSYEPDKYINKIEAGTIRERWEALKSHGEAFVTHCERGDFNRRAKS